jgi:hypothetical protein
MARRLIQGFSLKPIEVQAVTVLADRLARGNKSGFVAGLIVKAAKEEIGKDWEVIVSESKEKETAA